jgi:3-phosphoglycerate kinase
MKSTEIGIFHKKAMAMKVLVYSSLSYGRAFLESANQGKREFVLAEARLEEPTVVLAKDFPPICCFISDDVNSRVLEQSNHASTKTVPVTKIPDGWTIADIGPDTIREFSTELKKCNTVVWNGPVGVFQIPEFANGTHTMIKVLAGLEATTVIGGGLTRRQRLKWD